MEGGPLGNGALSVLYYIFYRIRCQSVDKLTMMLIQLYEKDLRYSKSLADGVFTHFRF